MPVYAEKEQIYGQKRWYIRTYVTDENGKSKQITRHNKNWIGRDGKKEAEWEENRLKNDIIQLKPKPKNITLEEGEIKYLNFLKGKVDNDTLKAKEKKLNHFCKIDTTNQVDTYPNKQIIKFNKEIYIIWQMQMKRKKYTKNKYSEKYFNFSIKYLNSIHNEICNMLDYLIVEGLCNINFAKQAGPIGTPKEIKMSKKEVNHTVIDYNEYLKLLEVSKDNLKYNTYFDLSFTRGPRPGEVRAFRVCDYNSKNKQLMVNFTMSKDNKLKEPKTASSKDLIDLDDTVNNKINLLIENLKKQKDFNENWYIFGGKKPISSHALDYAKDKYFKLAGINKHMKIHNFRHSCATWLFSIDVPITIISKILRHANIKETMKTYTHLLNKDYQKGLNTIDSFRIINQKQDQKQD